MPEAKKTAGSVEREVVRLEKNSQGQVSKTDSQRRKEGRRVWGGNDRRGKTKLPPKKGSLGADSKS